MYNINIITYNKKELDILFSMIDESKWRYAFHYPWEYDEKIIISFDKNGTADWHYAIMFTPDIPAIKFTDYIRSKKLDNIL